LGILAIVFGVLGILTGVCTTFSAQILQAFFGMLPSTPEGQEAMAAVKESAWTNYIFGPISVALAVMLLIAGIRLTRRLKSGVDLSVKWAIAKLAYALISGGIGVAQMMGTSHSDDEAVQAAAQTGGIIGGCIGIVWVCALPVFMLIWFNRQSIKDEVAGWS